MPEIFQPDHTAPMKGSRWMGACLMSLLMMLSGTTAARAFGMSGERVFRCPKAWIGLRADLLPTHWEVTRGQTPARLRSSQVQGGNLLCVYASPSGFVGTAMRLAPEGYRCLSDGRGVFRCRPSRPYGRKP